MFEQETLGERQVHMKHARRATRAYCAVLITGTALAALMSALPSTAMAQLSPVIDSTQHGVMIDLSVLEDNGRGRRPATTSTPGATQAPSYSGPRGLLMPGGRMPTSRLHLTPPSKATAKAPKLTPPGSKPSAQPKKTRVAAPKVMPKSSLAVPPMTASARGGIVPPPPPMIQAMPTPKTMPKSVAKAPMPAPIPTPMPAPKASPKADAKATPPKPAAPAPVVAKAPPPAPKTVPMPAPKPMVKKAAPPPAPKPPVVAVAKPAAAPPPAPKPTPIPVPKIAVSAPPPPPAQAVRQVTVPMPTQPTTQTAATPPVTSLKAGDVLRVPFPDTEAKLPNSEKTMLQTIAARMAADKTLRLQLKAYAGGRDLSASKARRLSLSRALSVRSYLIEKGVRSTRIDVRALGNKTTEPPVNRVDLNVIQR